MRNSSVRTTSPQGLYRYSRRRGKNNSKLPRLALALLVCATLALPAAALPSDGKQEPSGSVAAPAAEKKESGGELVRPVPDGVGGTPQDRGESGDAAATKTEDGGSPIGPVDKPAVKKEVKIDGEVPAPLLGRWLVLTALNLPDGPGANASLLEITRGTDGKVNFEHRTGDLPAELLDAAKASSKTGKDFTPSQDLLGRLAASWSKFPTDVESPPVRSLKYWFVTPDHYTDEFKSDEGARDAKAVLIVSRFPVPPPGGRAPVRTDLFFFIKDLTQERLAGPYTNFQLITGFAPVPVTLQGGFTAYRVGNAPSAGSGQVPAEKTSSPLQTKSSG